jgi:hypothetical protein
MVDELFPKSFAERMRINEQRRKNHNSSTMASTQQCSPYNSLTINKRMMFE